MLAKKKNQLHRMYLGYLQFRYPRWSQALSGEFGPSLFLHKKGELYKGESSSG